MDRFEVFSIAIDLKKTLVAFILCHVHSIDRSFENTKNIFDDETNRECVGYATGDILYKIAETDPWTTIDFKYGWKDIDCKMRAPFLCQYNPGKWGAVKWSIYGNWNSIYCGFGAFGLYINYSLHPNSFQIFLDFTKFRILYSKTV